MTETSDALAPPQDIYAEQCVLGGMMMSKDAIAEVVTELRQGEFYRPIHETIFDAILHLRDRGEPVDALSVRAELARRGELDRVGGAAYLHTLIHEVPTAANAGYYARLVRQAAVRRRIIEAGTRLVQMARSAADDPTEALDAARREIDAIEDRSQDEGETLGSALAKRMEAWQNPSKLPGVPTGLADLDGLLGGGLRPGQLAVIAARPAVGKSVLGIGMARTAAIRHGIRTLLVSLEMGSGQVTDRITSAETRISTTRFRQLHEYPLTEDEWDRIALATGRMQDAPLEILGAPRSVADVRQRMYGANKPGLVVIDYLQLLDPPTTRRQDTREREVALMTRGLKLMAESCQVPVVLLAQLNRGPEQRANKQPILSDLRESGSIEADADIVILLHREDVYEKETPRAGEIDLIVAKHREGPQATITAAFQGHYSRIMDLAAG